MAGTEKDDKKDPKSKEISNTTLHVTNLDSEVTSEQLSEAFSDIGPVRAAFVVVDKESGESRGFGYVKFVLLDDAQQATKNPPKGLGDITCALAKRRLRGDEEAAAARSAETPVWIKKKEDRKRKNEIHEKKQSGKYDLKPPMDAQQDKLAARTLLISGIPAEEDEEQLDWSKVLKQRISKIVAQLRPSLGYKSTDDTIQVKVDWPKFVDNDPVATVTLPTTKFASLVSEKIHNHFIQHTLLTSCSHFEHNLVTKSGRSNAGGRLVIRNLPFQIDESDIRRLFAPFGPIHSIVLPRKYPDSDKSMTKGFAFVWFLRLENAKKALEKCNGKKIWNGLGKYTGDLDEIDRGRVIAVDWALSKAQWEKMENQDDQHPQEPLRDNNNDEASRMEEDDDDDSDMSPEEYNEDEEEGEEEDSDMSPEEFNEDDDDDDEEEEEESDGDSDMSPVPLDEEKDSKMSVDEMQSKKSEEAYTVFVRNIRFETTDEQLYDLFKSFGPIKYARIVYDKTTKRSKGTGFVSFHREDDAQKVVDISEQLEQNKPTQENKVKNPKANAQSVLMADTTGDDAQSLTLHGRILGVSWAVSRDTADKLREDRDKNNAKNDKRNLYLLREGAIFKNSDVGSKLHEHDLEARQQSFDARKQLVRTNPSLFLSRVRLSVRQLPLFVDDKLFKKLARFALHEFDTEAKAGKRTALTQDEAAEGKQFKPDKKHGRIQQSKVMRQADRVDPLTGEGRSKGYGFLQFATHSDALKAVRWINGNKDATQHVRKWWKDSLLERIEKTKQEKAENKSNINDMEHLDTRLTRLEQRVKELEAEEERANGSEKSRSTRTIIVEFSIENAVTIKRRTDKIEKRKQFAEKRKQNAGQDSDGEDNDGDRKSSKFDRRKGDRRDNDRRRTGDKRGGDKRGGDRPGGDRRSGDRRDNKRKADSSDSRSNNKRQKNENTDKRKDANKLGNNMGHVIGKKRKQRKAKRG